MIEENKIDIIDFIVAEERKKAAEFQAQQEENVTVLNSINIFKENDPLGILSKDPVRIAFKSPAEVLTAYKTYFDMLTSKSKFSTSTFPLIDKKGDKYYWINCNGKNGSTGFKLPWFDGLEQLMTSYLWGMFAFKINLEDLYTEVNK